MFKTSGKHLENVFSIMCLADTSPLFRGLDRTGASKGFDSYTSKDELNQSDQGFFFTSRNCCHDSVRKMSLSIKLNILILISQKECN